MRSLCSFFHVLRKTCLMKYFKLNRNNSRDVLKTHFFTFLSKIWLHTKFAWNSGTSPFWAWVFGGVSSIPRRKCTYTYPRVSNRILCHITTLVKCILKMFWENFISELVKKTPHTSHFIFLVPKAYKISLKDEHFYKDFDDFLVKSPIFERVWGTVSRLLGGV